MGWNIELVSDKGEMLEVPAFLAGGIVEATYDTATDTMTPIPTVRARMSCTFNYSQLFRSVYGVDMPLHLVFDGMIADEAIPLLEEGVAALGTFQSDNYWEATPGNAGYILSVMLLWAQAQPNGVFVVTP